MKNKSIIETLPETMAGLDIGTTKIAVVVGSKGPDGKIDIHGYGKAESTGIQHGLIYNLNKTTDGINAAKEMTLTRCNLEIDSVYVGVAGRHIKSIEYKHTFTRINGKDKIIQQEEIDDVLKDLKNISINLGEEIISVIPQRFVIDRCRETSEPVGEVGEVIDGYFQIMTGNAAEIRKIVRCVRDANLGVKKIILEPIASGLSCLSHEEKKNGVIMIDIGGGTTDVAIFMDREPVFVRVIPIGGDVITNDIATLCKVPEETAEKLKTTYGTCIVEKSNSNNYITIPQLHALNPIQISEASLARIIHARVQEGILNEVKAAIEKSGYAGRVKSGIVLTGGGATLKHLKELFQYSFNCSVRMGIPEMGFVTGIPAELKQPMYSTGLGLLKYGIEQDKQIVIEIPEESESGFFWKSKAEKPKDNEKPEKKSKKERPSFRGHFDGFFDTFSDFLNDLLKKTEA